MDKAPIHGYDLYKQLASSKWEGVSLVWRIKQSLLYALLEKLQGEGLLCSTLVPGEAHPQRKEYQLTDAGKNAFYAWRVAPVQRGREIRQEFMAKLYFAEKAGPQIALELVKAQIPVCQSWLESMKISYAAITPGQTFERMLYQYRISQTENTLAWLNGCLDEFKHRPEE